MSGFPGIHLSFRFAWHWLTDGLILLSGAPQKVVAASFFRPATLQGVSLVWFNLAFCLCLVQLANSEMSPEKMSPERCSEDVLVFLLEDSWFCGEG